MVASCNVLMYVSFVGGFSSTKPSRWSSGIFSDRSSPPHLLVLFNLHGQFVLMCVSFAAVPFVGTSHDNDDDDDSDDDKK